MVYIWIKLNERSIIKQLEGNTFSIDELLLDSKDHNIVRHRITLRTDTNATYKLDFDLNTNEDDCNLIYFGISSPNKSFITSSTDHKNVTSAIDLMDWINNEVNTIREIMEKHYKIEEKTKRMEEDFK